MNELQQKTIEIAKKYLGTKEDPIGSNSGKQVMEFINSVGLTKPCSWCACYVYFSISNAAKELKIATKFKKSASCQVIYSWAKADKYILESPIEGCVFLQYHPELHRYAHTGIVVSYNKATNKFTTCEGNSNTSGSREGYEVCSNNRTNTKGKYIFVQIV